MKLNTVKWFAIGACFLSLLSTGNTGSLTDYGAIPSVAKPAGDLTAANQKLDFHTDLYTGRFNYSVQIVVPQARGGLTPNLALDYNSANKDSWCGVGWDLEFGYIQRETRYGVPIPPGTSSYYDGYPFTFTYSFGGHSGRLVSVGGGVYYPQINTDFLRFVYNGTSWAVTDKGGKQYVFGDSSACRISNSFGTFQWNLSAVTDPNGNKMIASYTADAGQLYLHEIDYNANTNSTAIATNCSIVFDLASGNRTDMQSSELGGTEIITEKLLQDIRVLSQGQSVRKYVLSYISSPSTGKALLQTVTEYGSDNITNLPPLTFGYSVLSHQFQNTVAWPIVSQTTSGDTYGDAPGSPDSMLIDVNGDGLPDRVMTEHTGTYTYFVVQLNTGSGFSSTLYQWAISDETGDTTEATWGGIDTSLNSGALMSIATLLDMNGDLLPDRVLRQHNPNGSGVYYDHYQFQANTGTGFATRANFGGVNSYNSTFTESLMGVPGAKTTDGLSDLITMVDMNGDGLPDRVMLSSTTSQFDIQFNSGGSYGNTGYSWPGVVTDANSVRPYAPRARMSPDIGGNAAIAADLMDMNGDGLPDRVLYGGVQLNNGHGFDSYSTSTWNYPAFPAYFNINSETYSQQFIDMNGDGLPDFVITNGPNSFLVFPNTGRGFNGGYYVWNNVDTTGGTGWDGLQAWYGNETRVMFVDINGDGLVDRVMQSYYGGDYLYVQLNAGPYPDLMNIVSNGLGGSVYITYTNSTSFNNSDGVRPRLPLSMNVVTYVTANDGRGNSATTSYQYGYGLYDTGFREFRGFGEVAEIDPYGAYTLSYFHQGGGVDGVAIGEYADDLPKAGMPYHVDSFDVNGLLYARTINKVDEAQMGTNAVYFPFVSQTIQLDYEGHSGYRASAKAYGYQASTGNLLNETNYGEVLNVDISAHTFTTTNSTASLYKQYTYAAIASNSNILDRVASVTESSDGAGSVILRQTTNAYFATTGNLASESELICPGTYATTSYTYDNYGNAQTITDPVGVVTTFNYDSATATYPTRKYTGNLTNNLIEYSLYDTRSGAVLASTNMQGMVASNAYDAFFRLTNSATSTIANGAATLTRKKFQYSLGGISLNYVHESDNDPADATTGFHETYTYFDGLARPIQSRLEAETGNYRVTDTAYDLRGNVSLQTYPVFESGTTYANPTGSHTNVYTQYDPIGRVSKVNPCASAMFSSGLPGTPSVLSGDTGSPVGPVSIAYTDGSANPWAIITTNALGQVHKYLLDAFGRTNQIVELTSGGNYNTSLSWSQVDDLLATTDNAGNQTSYAYDDMGRRVAVEDPDMGTWQYGYDLAGKLTVQTDAKGQQIKLTYSDSAGRLTLRRGFDIHGNQVSTNVYAYDSSSGDSAYTVYPGQLFSVTDDQGWQKSSYDVRGRTLKTVRSLSVNGNTYTNQYGFDDADRLVASIYPNGGPTVTNIFDTGGNLSQVKQVGGSNMVFYAATGFDAFDRLQGISFGNGVKSTNVFYGISQRLQQITSAKTTNVQNLTYTYDAVGNIKSVTDGVYGGAASGTLGNIQYDDLNRLTSLTNAAGSFSYGFDSIGNVKTNGEAGTSAYVYSSIRPHLVVSANGTNYAYDFNGNMVVRGNQRLAFDVNNRLAYVVTTNSWSMFGYDASGSRLWKASSGTNGLQVWIDGNYEEKNGQVLYHISAGGRLVCTFDKTGTNVSEYYHPDDLTSTSIQTDQNGNQIQNYGYSAFGRSRFTESTSAFPVSRRYTSQVLDDDTGLYYYNARYYDSQLARFISPDDIIPDPTDPQAYNRYSYCVNNPLRFTDTTGHFEDLGNGIYEFPNGYVGGPGLNQAETAYMNAAIAIQKGDTGTRDANVRILGTYVSSFPDSLGLIAKGAYYPEEVGNYMAGIAIASTIRGGGGEESLPEGGPIVSSVGVPEPETLSKPTLQQRANELHGLLDPQAQRMRTTAVTETQEGVTIVSSSRNTLTPAQRAALKPGEVEGVGPGHAEVTGLNAAKKAGLTPTATAASRPICQPCAQALGESGVTPASPLKAPKQ